MPITFKPSFNITPKIAQNLMAIEAVKEKMVYLPSIPTMTATDVLLAS